MLTVLDANSVNMCLQAHPLKHASWADAYSWKKLKTVQSSKRRNKQIFLVTTETTLTLDIFDEKFFSKKKQKKHSWTSPEAPFKDFSMARQTIRPRTDYE